VGAGSVAADAEICMMLADALEAVGIARGDYVIRVNNRKVLNGLLEGLRREDAEPLPNRISQVMDWKLGDFAFIDPEAILRTIDKWDKLGRIGVIELLTTGRTDASGAEIEGVGLSKSDAETVVSFLEAKGTNNAETLANLRVFVSEMEDVLSEEDEVVEQQSAFGKGIGELREIADLCAAQGYGPDRIVIDPSVVRGLGYYTGPVFEAELTFEITDDEGRPRQFGSVAGGGRYDDLVKRFTGQAVPATGISIGVDRLLAALHAKGLGSKTAAGPVVVTVMDRDRMADYLAMAAELRAAGIRAEVYLGNPKNFGNQLKYADRRGAPVAVIQGEDERARGVVQVKDLILGATIAETATLEEWKDQPAQVECAEGDLVATVRRMLERG